MNFFAKKTMSWQLILLVAVAITLTANPVFAQGLSIELPDVIIKPNSLLWGLKVALGNAHENFVGMTEGDEAKYKLKLEHANERQKEIEACTRCSPDQLKKADEIIKEKTAEVENSIDPKIKCVTTPCPDDKRGNVLSQTISVLRQAGELNEIRIAVAEFNDLRKMTDGEKSFGIGKETKASQIDNRINNLDIVKENCTERISSLDLQAMSDRQVFAELQRICPVLKNTTHANAMSILGGF